MPKELILPRKRIHFTPLQGGRLISLVPNIPLALQTPMVRSQGGDFQGFESGYRSGLVIVEDNLYKLKGSRPEGKEHDGGGPEGSQTLSLAQFEANRVLERREAFLKRGLPYPLEPYGFWAYDHVLYKGEPNAATIYKTLGDTRLDELLWYIEKIPLDLLSDESGKKFDDIITKMGFTIGHLLKIFHQSNFSWDATRDDTARNAHGGNVVIFPDAQEKTHFGIIDFDNSVNYHPGNDPDEDIVAMQETQRSDVIRFKNHIQFEKTVISGSHEKPLQPDAGEKLVHALLTQTLPHLSEKDREEVHAYLLKALRRAGASSARSRFIRALEDGYLSDTLTDLIPWSDVSNIPKAATALRKEAKNHAQALVKDETDQERLVTLAKRSAFYNGYSYPQMIDTTTRDPFQEETPLPPLPAIPDLVRDVFLQYLIILVQFHGLMQAKLAPHTSSYTGRDFFVFPHLSDEIFDEHRKLKKEAIARTAEEWINGDLQQTLEKAWDDPKAMGSFLLTLAQTESATLAQVIAATKLGEDDPDLSNKLSRVHMLLELIPPHAKKHTRLTDCIAGASLQRRDAFQLEQEAERKSAISLFGYGIITRELREIFNHGTYGIILNLFGEGQIPSLFASLTEPNLVDPLGGRENARFLLQIALTGALIRTGSYENLPFVPHNVTDEYNSIPVQYFFASLPKDAVTDSHLKTALAKAPQDDAQWWLPFLTQHVIIAKRALHPESYFTDSLRAIPFDADHFAQIIKTALDATNGDLRQIDPTLQEVLQAKTYSGRLREDTVTELVAACIGLGIDIPEILVPYVTNLQEAGPINVLSPRPVLYQHKDIYGTYPAYPIDPVYKVLSDGIHVLPNRLQKIFAEYSENQAATNRLAEGLLEHLFEFRGYFRNYFGSVLGTSDFPPPTITMKDINDSGWQFSRIVHPDIWEILDRADPAVIAEYFEKNKRDFPNGKIRIEFDGKGKQLSGYRDTPLSQCFPKDLYNKFKNLSK